MPTTPAFGGISLVNIRGLSDYWDVVKVDRSSFLGNPFDLKSEAQRDLVCDAYESYFWNVLKGAEPLQAAATIASEKGLPVSKVWKRPTRAQFTQVLKKLLSALMRGENIQLGCWCVPFRCHAETIKRYLEMQLQSLAKANL